MSYSEGPSFYRRNYSDFLNEFKRRHQECNELKKIYEEVEGDSYSERQAYSKAFHSFIDYFYSSIIHLKRYAYNNSDAGFYAHKEALEIIEFMRKDLDRMEKYIIYRRYDNPNGKRD